MTTLYDTLGVPKDASPEDIRRAYRRKAKALHPDREGGDTAEMARVNRAYQILSDPKRRETYDRTGSDADGPSVEHLALQTLRSILTDMIEQHLESGADFVTMMREAVHHGLLLLPREREKATRKIDRLERLRPAVVVKEGENIFTHLVDEKLASARAMLTQVERQVEIATYALEILKGYRSTMGPGPQRMEEVTIFFSSWDRPPWASSGGS